jgi:hypothetical protein
MFTLHSIAPSDTTSNLLSSECHCFVHQRLRRTKSKDRRDQSPDGASALLTEQTLVSLVSTEQDVLLTTIGRTREGQPGRPTYSSMRICTPRIIRYLPYGDVKPDRIRLRGGQRQESPEVREPGALFRKYGLGVPLGAESPGSLCLLVVINSGEGSCVDSAI